MRKLLLISISLLIAGGVFAEGHICVLNLFKIDNNLPLTTEKLTMERILIRECAVGDIIKWDMYSYEEGLPRNRYSQYGQDIVVKFCNQDKQITVQDNFYVGVCTFIGNLNVVKPRERSS